MKIIKRGEVPKPKVFLYTCKNCNSTLEVSGSDVTTKVLQLLAYTFITCPVCDTKINLTDKKIEWVISS